MINLILYKGYKLVLNVETQIDFSVKLFSLFISDIGAKGIEFINIIIINVSFFFIL